MDSRAAAGAGGPSSRVSPLLPRPPRHVGSSAGVIVDLSAVTSETAHAEVLDIMTRAWRDLCLYRQR